MPSCRTCMFSGLEPATEADAYRDGGRFIRTCVLRRHPAGQPRSCASWARDPGEAMLRSDCTQAVHQARAAQYAQGEVRA